MEERLDFDRSAFQSAEIAINECVKSAVDIQSSFTESFLTWRY